LPVLLFFLIWSKFFYIFVFHTWYYSCAVYCELITGWLIRCVSKNSVFVRLHGRVLYIHVGSIRLIIDNRWMKDNPKNFASSTISSDFLKIIHPRSPCALIF
jgi:hypothetical protein